MGGVVITQMSLGAIKLHVYFDAKSRNGGMIIFAVSYISNHSVTDYFCASLRFRSCSHMVVGHLQPLNKRDSKGQINNDRIAKTGIAV